MAETKAGGVTPLGFNVPGGACDCHMHVFAAQDEYPMLPQRSYTPPPARLHDYLNISHQLGLERVVFVQPSVYGTDNRCMLNAMRCVGQSARGVAVIDGSTTSAKLEALERAGVRGVRLNAASIGQDSKGQIEQKLSQLAVLVAPFGWHVQLFADLDTILALAPTLRRSPVPIVIDHMGLAMAAGGVEQLGFSTLLELLADGDCWIKVTGADRISGQETNFTDSVPIAQALITANPARVVWGTDWPHTPNHAGQVIFDPDLVKFRSLDDSMLLSLLVASAGDAATLHRILVENPASLYSF